MKPNLLMAIILPVFSVYPQYNAWHGSDDFAQTTGMWQTDSNPFPTIGSIPLPDGYARVLVEKKSFSEWLRNTTLKKSKTVYLYDGSVKRDQSMQYAVLNISTGHKDLQQCADAVMRLRAEYFYSQKRFNEIHFYDNNNVNYAFSYPTNRDHFNAYLEKVFAHCGTLSLEKQLRPVPYFNKMEIGDVLIHGGSPGHAMLVVDIATNNQGKQIYLLAQGYMPAQDIHVVVNPMNRQLSPWYEMNDENINTPGWTFSPKNLRKWPEGPER